MNVPPRSVGDWVKALAPVLVELAEDVAHAGDDPEALAQARMKHDRRVSDAIMRAKLGLRDEP